MILHWISLTVSAVSVLCVWRYARKAARSAGRAEAAAKVADDAADASYHLARDLGRRL